MPFLGPYYAFGSVTTGYLSQTRDYLTRSNVFRGTDIGSIFRELVRFQQGQATAHDVAETHLRCGYKDLLRRIGVKDIKTHSLDCLLEPVDPRRGPLSRPILDYMKRLIGHSTQPRRYAEVLEFRGNVHELMSEEEAGLAIRLLTAFDAIYDGGVSIARLARAVHEHHIDGAILQESVDATEAWGRYQESLKNNVPTSFELFCQLGKYNNNLSRLISGGIQIWYLDPETGDFSGRFLSLHALASLSTAYFYDASAQLPRIKGHSIQVQVQVLEEMTRGARLCVVEGVIDEPVVKKITEEMKMTIAGLSTHFETGHMGLEHPVNILIHDIGEYA